MGASYAIYRFVKQQWEARLKSAFDLEYLYQPEQLERLGRFTFCCATDGNHGRAVAWFARKLGQKAVIYMPQSTVEVRIENIRREGADVIVVDGDYDDAVRRAARDAETNHWQVIADTSYPGYTEIPWWIMAGYTTIFREMEPTVSPESRPEIDFVFLQVGVGSFAASAAWYYRRRLGASGPSLISVEPIAADCFLESIRSGHGEAKAARGKLDSIMAGLNCGTPSLLAWPIVRDGIDFFLSVGDEYARNAMRILYCPKGEDPAIISGESGAAGLAGLLALLSEESLSEARERLGINGRSRILLINTEGDTDPGHFREVVGLED